MKQWLILVGLLFCAPAIWGQNTRYDNIVLSSRGTPVAFATVAVCTQPANVSTTPCSPLATIFSTTGGAAQANPLTTDINGNYHFYATPGSLLTIQVFSPQIATPFVMTDINIPPLASNTPVISGNNAFTGNNTHSGTETFAQVNKTIYADGVTNTTIQAALNAAPAGATVIVPAGCSGTVATPSATITISQAVRLIIQCNITSSQVPNISIQSSGVTIEGGGGNSPSGGSTDAAIWTNSGTGNTIIYGDGVTSFRGLAIEKLNFRDSGAHLAARSILFRANAADISIRDVVTVGIGFDGSQGNQELIRFERVRINNYVNRGFNFDCTGNQFCNSITFNSTYADLGTGAPGVGYDLGNGNFILQATDSDFAPTCGYRFVGGGTVTAQGTDDESGSVAGWCVTGATGNVTLVGPKAVGEVLPISITGAASVTLINPNTTGTTGANSITLGAGATGQNFLYGASGLDKLISGVNAPSVTLQTFGSTGTGYALTCTAVPCVNISANTIVNGAALQIANINAGGSSYNFGELFNNGTFDIRSTLGGGGFSFNSNGAAGRGIFTFTNTADRIYTFPNSAASIAAFNVAQTWSAAQTLGTGASLNATSLLVSPTAPTIAAGGCGGAAASISNSNGTAAFEVNVGTTPTSACTITMPTAAHKWICTATDLTTNSTSVFLQKQSPVGSQTTTQIVITNFSDVAAATAFVASDIMGVSCHAY